MAMPVVRVPDKAEGCHVLLSPIALVKEPLVARCSLFGFPVHDGMHSVWITSKMLSVTLSRVIAQLEKQC